MKKPTNQEVDKLLADVRETLNAFSALFFEDEPEVITSVWQLSTNKKQKCWIITGKGQVMSYHTQAKPFAGRRDKGDVFLTQEAAVKELANRVKQAGSRMGGLIG